MALTMEVRWRSADLGTVVMSKKRSWGEDQQKLFDLMVGASNTENTRHTLDLLGSSSSNDRGQSEFVELDPEMPLPSGWEKRLDLKSGTVYFINWNTGTTTRLDPRKTPPSMQLAVSHDFLSSKWSEMQLQQPNMISRSDGQEDLQYWERIKKEMVKIRKAPGLEEERLELNLNLAINDRRDSSVCSMERVQQALARTAKLGGSKVSSFLTATAVVSERSPCRILPSTAPSPTMSPSSSSSSSAVSCKRVKLNATAGGKYLHPSESETESKLEASSVRLTGCKQCFMYVMLSASDPKCPRCGSTDVVLDFPLFLPKKSNVELNL